MARGEMGGGQRALFFGLAGDEGGGMGGGVGRWPMEGGQGGGGHQRAVWEQQKVQWFPFLGGHQPGWGDGGRRGEVAHGGRARGGDGVKSALVHFFRLPSN